MAEVSEKFFRWFAVSTCLLRCVFKYLKRLAFNVAIASKHCPPLLAISSPEPLGLFRLRTSPPVGISSFGAKIKTKAVMKLWERGCSSGDSSDLESLFTEF